MTILPFIVLVNAIFSRLIDIIHERVLNVLLHPDFIYNRTALGKKQEKLTDYITNFNKNVW